jgi:hypothetical protein
MQVEVDRKGGEMNMRVDPMMQLHEAITSLFETMAYLSVVALAVIALVSAIVEWRRRVRDAAVTAAPRDSRRRREREAPAAG